MVATTCYGAAAEGFMAMKKVCMLMETPDVVFPTPSYVLC